jgi:PilZ domain
MFDNDLTQESARQDLDPDLLASLERQQGDQVSRSRMHARVDAKLKVIVQPGNSSEVLRFKLQGITADLSRGGCRLFLPLPLGVGDVFRITFDSSEHQVPLAFARCLRCRLLREDAYECGFSFFAPIDLPASLTSSDEELLG